MCKFFFDGGVRTLQTIIDDDNLNTGVDFNLVKKSLEKDKFCPFFKIRLENANALNHTPDTILL